MMSPADHPARTIHGIPAKETPYPYLNWGSVMASRETEFLEKPWLIYIDERGDKSTWSYAVFIDTARRLASLLNRHGVERGGRVAIASHNHPDTILAYFACWLLGACAVPLNMTEDDGRLAYILSVCTADAVLCRSDYMSRVSQLYSGSAQIVEMDSDVADPEFYRALRREEPHPYPSDSEDMRWDNCLLVYTSGTTGNPKGVMLVQQNLFADGLAITDWHGIDQNTRMMCVLPVHHVNGTIVTHVTPFLAGASVVLNRKFSPHRFFGTIQAEQVNVVSVVPTLLALLLEARADALDCKELGFRHVICGAGPLTCELAQRFETEYGIPIIHGYGLSETTCYSCFVPRNLQSEEHQRWMYSYGFPSIGQALPCNEMSIHTADGETVADGERGEIVVRGTSVMRGYDNNEKANNDAFTYGWFRSGDEGFRVADSTGTYYYFITGRLKELIIRGGINLAPLEIDEVLNRAPGVRAGICVGFENTMYGEEVGALVIANEGASADEILVHCRANLPFHKCPKVVLFATELPVTSTGKYQRNKVKHLFAEWKNSQFRK